MKYRFSMLLLVAAPALATTDPCYNAIQLRGSLRALEAAAVTPYRWGETVQPDSQEQAARKAKISDMRRYVAEAEAACDEDTKAKQRATK